MLQHLFEGYPAWVAPAVALTLTAVVAYLIADLVARLVRVPLVRALESTDVGFSDPIVRTPVRIIRVVIFLVAALGLAFPALETAGWSHRVGLHAEALGTWVLTSGLRIAIIILFTWAVVRIVAVLFARVERNVRNERGQDAIDRAKRVRTLGDLVRNGVAAVLSGAALMMVLRELNIDILPLLTGAGIAGLAVGFGAQTLVKDVISGFFIILEDQVRVGDAVAINGTGGVVEAIHLRTIVLRDVEGAVHVFPNGGIATLSNRSKDYAFAVIDVGVAYKEDPDHVMAVLRRVGEELRAEPRVGPAVLEPLEVLGVEAFGESSMTIRARIRTLPMRQWEVVRELRRRVKMTFEREGIEIPFPHRTIVMQTTTPPAVQR
jgi:small conductance mechanosensitive channel